MSSSILLWKNSRVVYSDGDYTNEAYLEDYDSPLLQYQRTLPLLPVPTIEHTIERFLHTALPLANNEDERVSLRQACSEFPLQAQLLQDKLLARASERKDTSWLLSWWNSIGYLQVRDPNIVHVSYFFQLGDDPTLGQGDRQIHRCASLLTSAFAYATKVVSGDLPQETIGKDKDKVPLCSSAYKYMFHATRIPKRIQDSYRIYNPAKYPHAVVAVQGQFFQVPLTNVDGTLLSLQNIETGLQECIDRASWTYNNESPLELGWLTTMNRDDWADARHLLLQLGGQPMADALELLESGMLLLCLDDDDAFTPQQRGLKYWHGGQSSGGNRWADKSIQLVCSRNGKVGFVGEHSMMDGMPAVGFCNYLQHETYESQNRPDQNQSGIGMTEVKNIFEDVFSILSPEDRTTLHNLIDKAKADFTKLTTDYELEVQSFRGYGSSWMKHVGCSPDAYVQMAIQLATFRLFGSQQATYESSQVRRFLHGRTETTRTVSPAGNAFLHAMNQQGCIGEKERLLRLAIQSHVDYSRNAGKGHGVDRHFLGLSLLLEEGDEVPVLFTDPLFQRSKRWRVSTSTLPNMPGFGPVVPDGVGIGYEVRPDSCVFTITGRTEFAWADRLSHLLEESLLEMKLIFGDIDEIPRSKL